MSLIVIDSYNAVATLQAVNHKMTITISSQWNVWEHKHTHSNVCFTAKQTPTLDILYITGIQNIHHSVAQGETCTKQYHTAKNKIYHCIYIESEAVETKMWVVVILLLVSELL